MCVLIEERQNIGPGIKLYVKTQVGLLQVLWGILTDRQFPPSLNHNYMSVCESRCVSAIAFQPLTPFAYSECLPLSI